MRYLLRLLPLIPTLYGFAQDSTPKLIIPGKEKQVVASLKLAKPFPPASLSGLGLLKDHAVAYFSMEATETGGLAWSKVPIGLEARPEVVAREEGGRKYLDFSAKKSGVKFEPAYRIGPKFTIAAWIQLPTQSGNAIVWQGSGGDYVKVEARKLSYWVAQKNKWAIWAETAEPFAAEWYHLALVKDGGKVQLFLNAKPLAIVDDLKIPDLDIMGNHKSHEARERTMAAGIDEQYFFSKALTPAEVATVMKFSKVSPVKEPGRRSTGV